MGDKAVNGSPVVLLTVAGRKTGTPLTVPVADFPLGDGWVVVGSAGGDAAEPQWFRNLRATDNAGVLVGDQRHDVSVRVLEGVERDVAFAGISRGTRVSASTRARRAARCPWRSSHPAEADSLHARHTMAPQATPATPATVRAGVRKGFDVISMCVRLAFTSRSVSPSARTLGNSAGGSGDATSRHTRVYPSPTRPSAADVVVPRYDVVGG